MKSSAGSTKSDLLGQLCSFVEKKFGAEETVGIEADRLRREEKIRLLRLMRRKFGGADPEPITCSTDPAERIQAARARLRKLIKDSRKRQKPALRVVPGETGPAESRSKPRAQINEDQGTGRGGDLSDELVSGPVVDEAQPYCRAKNKKKPLPPDDRLADYRDKHTYGVGEQLALARRLNEQLLRDEYGE